MTNKFKASLLSALVLALGVSAGAHADELEACEGWRRSKASF